MFTIMGPIIIGIVFIFVIGTIIASIGKRSLFQWSE